VNTTQCDECVHYDYHAERPCLLGHRPRFYLPTEGTILNQRWGHRRVCGDFKPAGERRDEVTEADLPDVVTAGHSP